MKEYKLKPGKIGDKLIETCQKVEDKFVDTFLEDDGSLKTGGIDRKVTDAYKRVEDTVVDGYKKVEDTVVGGYKKVEDAVVGGYKKIENAFTDAFLEEKDSKSSDENTPSKHR